MPTSLEKPGVKIRRTFSKPTVQLVAPTLMPAIAGPCHEVLDLYDEDGNLNNNALVSVPAQLIGSNILADVSDLVGTTFKVTLSKGTGSNSFSFTFPSNLKTFETMFSYLEAQFPGLNFRLSENKLIITSEESGSNIIITIGDGDANDVFGFVEGQSSKGATSYENNQLIVPLTSVPIRKIENYGKVSIKFDSNLFDSIDFYLKNAGKVKPLSKTSGVLMTPYRFEYQGSIYGRYTDDDQPFNSTKKSYSSLNYVKTDLQFLASNIVGFLGEDAKFTVDLPVNVDALKQTYGFYIGSNGGADNDFYYKDSEAYLFCIYGKEYITGKTIKYTLVIGPSPEIGFDESKNLITQIVTNPTPVSTVVNDFNAWASKSDTIAKIGVTLQMKPLTDDNFSITANNNIDPVVIYNTTTDSSSVTFYNNTYRRQGFTNYQTLTFKYQNDSSVGEQTILPPDAPGSFQETSPKKYTYTCKLKPALVSIDNNTIIYINDSAYGLFGKLGDETKLDIVGDSNIASIKLEDGKIHIKISTDITSTKTIGKIIKSYPTSGSGNTFTFTGGSEIKTPILNDHSVINLQQFCFTLFDDENIPYEFSGGRDPVIFDRSAIITDNKFTYGTIQSNNVTGLLTGTIAISIFGSEPVIVGSDTGKPLSEIVSEINNKFGKQIASIPSGAKYMTLDLSQIVPSLTYGRDGINSSIKITKVTGKLCNDLFGTTETTETTEVVYYGYPKPVKKGDIIYIDGNPVEVLDVIREDYTFYDGNNVVSLPVKLKLNGNFNVTTAINNWYIVRNNIDVASSSASDDPLPELIINKEDYYALIIHDLIKTDGKLLPKIPSTTPIYCTYKALRVDPALLDGYYVGTDAALDALTPFIPDNPLGFAAKLMFETSGGVIGFYVCAIDDISYDQPDGTTESWKKAFKALGAKDVYAISVLTQDGIIHKYAKEHAELYSSDKYKSERIVIINPKIPVRHQSVLAVSGNGIKVEGTNDTIQLSSEINLNQVLSDLEITDPTDSEQFFAKEIYVEIQSDDKHYLVYSMDPSQNKVKVHVSDDWWREHEGNEDKFYAITPLPEMQADGEEVKIYTRGAKILETDTVAMAESMAQLASNFDSLFVRIVAPDEISLDFGTGEYRVPGYYLASIAAAQVTLVKPPDPITRTTIPFVTHSYTPKYMSDFDFGIMAAGGVCVAVNETDGTVKWRDFLTTKTDLIENFEHSLITPDHFASKIFRMKLLPLVGVNAITSEFLATLKFTSESVASWLVENKIYKQCSIESIETDESDPRQIILKVKRSMFYPVRGILVILL